MFQIKFLMKCPGLDDRFVVSIGPKQIKTCGIWDGAIFAACINPIKRFKTAEEATRLLKKYKYIDENGKPGEALMRAGVKGVEIEQVAA